MGVSASGEGASAAAAKRLVHAVQQSVAMLQIQQVCFSIAAMRRQLDAPAVRPAVHQNDLCGIRLVV